MEYDIPMHLSQGKDGKILSMGKIQFHVIFRAKIVIPRISVPVWVIIIDRKRKDALFNDALIQNYKPGYIGIRHVLKIHTARQETCCC